MKKILFSTLLCLSFTSTTLAKTNDTNAKIIETNICENNHSLRLLYKCNITVTTTYPDGSKTTVIYSYTLDSGTKTAAEEWCENKKQQFY